MIAYHGKQRLQDLLPVATASALIALVAIGTWWSHARDIHLKYALGGFSPMDWVNHVLHPGNFALDFPGGTDAYGASSWMYLYLAAESWFSVEASALVWPMIAAEIILVVAGTIVLLRTTVRKELLTPLAVAVVIAIVISSNAMKIDLARQSLTQFWGLYYGVGAGLRMVGLALFFTKRYYWSAFVLGIAYTVHPTVALLGFAVAGLVYLATERPLRPLDIAGPLLVFVGISGAWLLLTVDPQAVLGQAMPLSKWISVIRGFGYEFSPVHNEMFTTRYWEALAPLLSLAALFVYYLPDAAATKERQRQLASCAWAVLALAIIGVLISVWPPQALLVRLALHRSTEIFNLIGVLVVIPGLLSDVREGPVWRKAIALAVLVSPFMLQSGFPNYATAALVIPVLLEHGKNARSARSRAMLAILVGLNLVVSPVYYILGYSSGHVALNVAVGGSSLLVLTILMLLVFVISNRFRNMGLSSGINAAIVVAAIALFSFSWISGHSSFVGDKPTAQAFLAAQIWARDNTKHDALFMVDPAIHYGWRDYSKRSSFGNTREWIYTSVVYKTKADLFAEGVRRLREFDVELWVHLGQWPAWNANDAVRDLASKRFYSAGDDWRIAMAMKYKIDYIVLLKSKMSSRPGLPVAYENPYVLIVRSRLK